MLWNKHKFLAGFLFLPFFITAQQFHYRSVLDTIRETGFYTIPVTSVMSSFLKTDISDIRIADANGQWIPHIINHPYDNQTHHNVLFDIPVIKKDNSSSRTIVIVRKTSIDKLSNLQLVVNNTTASRFASLSGSDDQTNWFTIADSILLKDPHSILDNKSAFTINFPAVAYAYFRVTIFNGGNDPLNIKQVMTDAPDFEDEGEKFITNPKTLFNQTDTIGFSLVRVENTDSVHFNNIYIRVDFPKYFERNTRLYLSYPGNIADLLRMNAVTDFILSSNETKGYVTGLRKNKIFFLLIENKDNPPLRINEITTTQGNRQIIAYLEKGKEYHLLLDAPEAGLPNYDLKNFRNNIPPDPPVLNAGKITELTNDIRFSGKQKNRKWWIWPAIGMAIILLSWLTLGLTKDMRNRA